MEMQHKLYKRRWLMIGLFVLYAFIGSLQWAEFTIISHLIQKYYGVSGILVEWTSLVFTLSYVVFVFPALYVLDKLGVRNTLILGVVGVTIGTWIKVFSVDPNHFYMVMIGQIIVAISYMSTYGLIGRLGALWFGADEISTAGVLAMLGDQLGVVMTFALPPILVKSGSIVVVESGMKRMHWFIAGISTIDLLLISLFFESAPLIPPSIAQAKQREIQKQSVWADVKNICCKFSFVLIMISYGLSLGPYIAISTLLNDLFVVSFPGEEEQAGTIGSIMVLSGIVGSFTIGRLLDKTRCFKQSAVVLTICSAIGMACLTFAFKHSSLVSLCVASAFLGFTILGYYATGYQIGIEVTYPVPESITTAIMILATQIFGLLITVIYSSALKLYGAFVSNMGLTMIYVICAIATVLIPANLKRQQAENTISGKHELGDLL